MRNKTERKRKTSILDIRVQAHLKRLRYSRKPKYTQDDIADVVGEKWTGAQISQIETGRRGIENEKLERIAAFFKVDPGEFFQPIGPKRKLVRSLVEAMSQEYIKSLRNSPKYPRLITRLKNVIWEDDQDPDKEDFPEEQLNG